MTLATQREGQVGDFLQAIGDNFWQGVAVIGPIFGIWWEKRSERKRAREEHALKREEWEREDERRAEERQLEEVRRLRDEMSRCFPQFLDLSAQAISKLRLAASRDRRLPDATQLIEELSEAYHRVLVVCSDATAKHAVEIFDETKEFIESDMKPPRQFLQEDRAGFVREAREDMKDPESRVLDPQDRTMQETVKRFGLDRV